MDKLKISKDKQEHMISLLQNYFLTERDEELGDLPAMLLLDFIVTRLGPEFYNQGVYDAHRYMMEKVEDLLEIQR